MSDGRTSTPGSKWLQASAGRLCDDYDLAIVDLDGTVYVGRDAVPGAPQVLGDLAETRMRVAFVTNNAARTPDQVARALHQMGVDASPDDVVTSAQAAAATLRTMVPSGSAVLVVGGRGIEAALEAEGFRPVTSAHDGPAAVVQGWTPELDWRMLAEGAYALATGVPWVATNTDLTVPTGGGIAPGNGSFVALLGRVVDRVPDVVAGKPGVALLEQTALRYRANRPLVVGDRLDTDIAGAIVAGMDSLLVLTGVTSAEDLLRAGPEARPTYVGADVGALLEAQPAVPVRDWGQGSGDALLAIQATRGTAVVDVRPAAPVPADVLDVLRTAAAAAWSLSDSGLDLHVGAALKAVLDRAAPAAVTP
jgi:glycerol-1-phosphatase